MKKRLIYLCLIAFAFVGMLYGQTSANSDAISLSWQEFPIASIDNIFIPFANPSLLATGHADGLSYIRLADKGTLQNRYWLSLASGGNAYVYERYNKNDYHLLATGFEALPPHILPNLYLGLNYRFKNEDIADGTFRSSLSYRPFNFSSLAFTLDNPMKAAPSYRAGLALRPFAFSEIGDHRLELSADFAYAKNGTDYELQKPTLGINTQIVDGLKLGATFNLEEKTALASFSLSFGKTEAGALAHLGKGDQYGYVYGHLANEAFKPLAGLSNKNWYEMKSKANIVSYKAAKYEAGPFQIYDKKTKSIEELARELNKAKNDPKIEGILFVNPSFGVSFALQQEMIELFKDFKESGKRLSFYFDNISNGGYIFAASIADKIYLNPQGSIDLRGLAISSPYLKDLLTGLGIEPVNFRSHKYKNAGNMFSENEMTEAEREMYDSLLESLYNQIADQIATGRGSRLNAPIKELIDQGPYFDAMVAFQKGLVDKVIYQDELNKQLKEDFSFSAKTKELTSYRDDTWAKPKENLIAVIYANGNIVMGEGKTGKNIAHQTTVDLIRKARKDPKYKGILVRVDSGGGSAQASDIILRELELAQKENKKPVVVSMAGTAASGGYYIAAKADKIVADKATLTGSIGVIGIVFEGSEAFKKLKVNWSTVKKGERSDMGSLYRPWKEDEKELLESFIAKTYDEFVGIVAEGRGKDEDYIHSIAQGRVWTGEQALELGLVDVLGGLDVAKEEMREVAGIKGFIRLCDASSSKKGIRIDMSSKGLVNSLIPKALRSINEPYTQIYEMWKDLDGEKALFIAPILSDNLEY